MPKTIYLDYNATTPLDPGVREAMRPLAEESYGNPSSVHSLGRAARARLDDFRARCAAVLGANPREVLFTSGGTESTNTAILGAARKHRDRGRHLITSPVEHQAVLACFDYLSCAEGFEVSFLPVDSAGRVDPSDLSKTFRADTILVSVMAANNETGVIQPVAEIGSLCRSRGILFHTDAIQWFGKKPVESIEDFGADLVSLCAHKFHGPKGSGLLWTRSPSLMQPLLLGGPQENERRAGTENLPAIAGLALALERFILEPVFRAKELGVLCDAIVNGVGSVPDVNVHSSTISGLPNTVAVTVGGAESISLLAALDLEGICASSGSACSSGSITPSHVLRAMGVPDDRSRGFLRFSLGRESTITEVEHLLSVFPEIVARVRGRG